MFCNELLLLWIASGCFGMNNPATAHIRLPTNTYNWLLLDGPILVRAHLNPSLLILLLQRASPYHCPSLLRCLMTNCIFFFPFFFSKPSCAQCFLPSGCSHKAVFEHTHARQHHRCIIISPWQPLYSMGIYHQQCVWYILDALQQGNTTWNTWSWPGNTIHAWTDTLAHPEKQQL